MNVKFDKTPQKAAKLVESALELDGRDRSEEAYIKYLESVSFIASSLRDRRLEANRLTDDSLTVDGAHLTKKQTLKLLAVARQCLDRIETLTEELEGDAGETTTNLETSSPKDMLVARPLGALATSRSFPVEQRKLPTGSSSLSFNLQGKRNFLLESIDWISPQEPSLEDELNTLKDITSPLEKASRENESLIATYRVRMERALTASARSNLQLELQRRIAENLDMARQRQETFEAQWKRRRQLRLDSAALTLRLRGDEKSSKKMLLLLEETLEYEMKQVIFAQLREKLERLPVGPVDLKLVQTVIRKTLMDTNHPLSKEVKSSARQVLDQIRSHLKSSNNNNEDDELQDGNMELDEEVDEKCIACKDEDLNEKAAAFEDIYCQSIDQVGEALLNVNDAMKSLKKELKKQKSITRKISIKKSLKKLQSVNSSTSTDAGLQSSAIDPEPQASLKDQFNECVRSIIGTLERLINSFVLVYGKMFDGDDARDACRIHIESHFYPHIYQAIFSLCGLVCEEQEKRLQQSMERLADCSPLDLGYRDTGANNALIGCEEATVALSQLVNHNVPAEKLHLLVQVAKAICKSNAGDDQPQAKSISADDLIPLLSYACIRSSRPQLVSECFLLEALTHQKHLMGEEGYCLTSLQTSLQYIASLPPTTTTEKSTLTNNHCLESTV